MPSCRPWVAICWRRWRLTAKTRPPTSWPWSTDCQVNLAQLRRRHKTYADFMHGGRVIDAYNLAQSRRCGKAGSIRCCSSNLYSRQRWFSADQKPEREPKRALHQLHRRHRRQNYRRMVDCSPVAGVLQPGERRLRGQRPHHPRRSQAAPPVRHRSRSAERLLRHDRRHQDAMLLASLSKTPRRRCSHHRHHPEESRTRSSATRTRPPCW